MGGEGGRGGWRVSKQYIISWLFDLPFQYAVGGTLYVKTSTGNIFYTKSRIIGQNPTKSPNLVHKNAKNPVFFLWRPPPCRKEGFLAHLEPRKFTLPAGEKPPFLHLKGTEFTQLATHLLTDKCIHEHKTLSIVCIFTFFWKWINYPALIHCMNEITN